MIDLRQFRYFLAIVEHGNFSRAAAALNVSQPSLSVAMKTLESALGTPLLHRGMKGVDLTDVGRIFERRARTAVREADRAFEEVRTAVTAKSGKVSIGTHSSLTPFLVDEALARFYASHPQIDVEVNVSTQPVHDVNYAIDGARWDFGVVLLRPDHALAETLKTDLLTQFDSRVYVGAGHPLAKASSVSLEDLARYDWVASSAALASKALFREFRRIKVREPRFALITNSFSLIRTMATRARYLSILPQPFAAAAVKAGDLVEVKQSYLSVTSKVYLVYPKYTRFTPAAADLANVVREVAKEVVG